MSDEMEIGGKFYISSKRASVLSGYAQDYIGQLARKSLINAQRIGGLWYVEMASLDAYKKKADEYKPQPPSRVETQTEPGTLVFFDGKEYISAGSAADLTGYAQDYVGQLARSGTILSRQVGNRWYVEKGSILGHKREKDGLLAAVQSASVGLKKPVFSNIKSSEYVANVRYSGPGPLLRYVNEGGDLMPVTRTTKENEYTEPVKYTDESKKQEAVSAAENGYTTAIPIKRTPKTYTRGRLPAIKTPVFAYTSLPAPKDSSLPLLLAAAATIIIVVSVGYTSILKQNSAYATNVRADQQTTALAASVAEAFTRIGNVLEPLLTKDLVYTRSDSQ